MTTDPVAAKIEQLAALGARVAPVCFDGSTKRAGYWPPSMNATVGFCVDLHNDRWHRWDSADWQPLETLFAQLRRKQLQRTPTPEPLDRMADQAWLDTLEAHGVRIAEPIGDGIFWADYGELRVCVFVADRLVELPGRRFCRDLQWLPRLAEPYPGPAELTHNRQFCQVDDRPAAPAEGEFSAPTKPAPADGQFSTLKTAPVTHSGRTVQPSLF